MTPLIPCSKESFPSDEKFEELVLELAETISRTCEEVPRRLTKISDKEMQEDLRYLAALVILNFDKIRLPTDVKFRNGRMNIPQSKKNMEWNERLVKRLNEILSNREKYCSKSIGEDCQLFNL
jgi:hypothetical protein